MSKIRIEFVILGKGLEMTKTDDFFIEEIVASQEITATTTETTSANWVNTPARAGYAILRGVEGDTLVGYGVKGNPSATAKGILVREGKDPILKVQTGNKFSFKSVE